MAERVADDYWDDWGAVLLWTAVFSGPLGWVISELVGYWFVKPVCANGHRVILTVIAAIGLALTLCGLRIGWWCFSQVRRSADEEGGRTVDRSYFMSLVGLGLNGLAAIYIVTTGIIPYLMGACE